MRVGVKEINKGSRSSAGLVRREPLAALGLQVGKQPLPTHGAWRIREECWPTSRGLQHHVREMATAFKNMSRYIPKS